MKGISISETLPRMPQRASLRTQCTGFQHPRWRCLLGVVCLLLGFGESAGASDTLRSQGNFLGRSVREPGISVPAKPEHPFRILVREGKTNFCDLRPLFKWYEQVRGLSWSAVPPSPMPDWRSVNIGKVLSVRDGELLVEHVSYIGGRRAVSPPKLLRNYPGAAKCKDEDTISFIAFDTRTTYQYRDFLGGTHTVGVLDHGVPYDPYARRSTNYFAVIGDPASPLITISNVVSFDWHEPHCCLIKYLEAGRTNEFHAWAIAVQTNSVGK